MIHIEFSDQDVETLFEQKEINTDHRLRKRAEVLYLKSLKLPHATIEQIARISAPTLAAYLNTYKKEGISFVTTRKYYQPKSDLEPHTQKIKEYFEKHPPASSQEAADKIKEITSLSKQGVEKKVEEQAEFLKNTLQPLIEQAEAGKIKVYFVDAAHFVMEPYLGFLWCFVRCFILSSPGRQRYNILGALDFKRKKLISICNDAYINSESVCHLLRKLSRRSRGLPIKIILDNAPYQRCKKVQEYALSLNIELVFLPSYSPQFNLIERFWKFLKKKCLYSKYYENFQLFKEAINEFIENINKYKKELKTLITPNFQTFENIKIVTV
jgi:transposase